MITRAAILREGKSGWELSDLEIGVIRDDEVLVRIVATGICHTDLAMFQRPTIPRPIVLGHEGAGVVEQVGSDVRSLKPGDHVILSYDYCGVCSFCLGGHPAYCREARPMNFGGTRPDGTTALSENGKPVYGHFFGQSSFATHAVVRERNAIPVDPDLPLDLLAPLGCGVQTGAGAVLNVLQPPPGSSIVIFGAGSVGLSALLAARVAGCETIVAVDLRESRLQAAIELGATHAIDAGEGSVADRIRTLTGGRGVDCAFSTTGNAQSLRDAVDALDFMGTAAFVAGGGEATIATSTLLWGRTLRGVVQGDSVSRTFIPHLIELWQQGRFPFDRLIHHYAFDEINDAAGDSLAGNVIKPVLRLP